MQRLIFILICTLLLIKPSANAIYLSTLGVENLPLAFLGVAVVAFFVTSLYNRYINVISPKTLFIRSLIICIVILLILGTLMWFSWAKNLSAYLFYLFMSIFGILSASQFWILANQAFNAREARKFFSIIGIGAIAGGIAGGYLASIISSFLQSESLLFIGAGLLIISIFFIRKMNVTSDPDLKNKTKSADNQNILLPFRLIKKSQHLKYLAIILALSVFVAKMIDYQFGYFATNTFEDEESLTAFFGFWYSSFNLISLLIQLFLTTRIVGKFGVGMSLLILPFILLVNISILIFIPILTISLISKLSDASMKQSINKSAVELMMLPIPEDIKLRTKPFLDVFVDSLATGFSGLCLLFIVKALDLPNIIITLVILVSVFGWLFYSNRMRKEYKSVFRQSLKILSDQQKYGPTTVNQDYNKILAEGNRFQKIKALRQLKDHPIGDFEPTLNSLLFHDDPLIVRAVLECIMYHPQNFISSVFKLLDRPEQDIRISALEYLIIHQYAIETDFLDKFLKNDKMESRLIGIAALAKEYQNNPKQIKELKLKEKLAQELYIIGEDDSTASQIICALKAISYGKFKQFYFFIDKHLSNPNNQIRHNAILAAGETRSSKFLMILVKLLDQSGNESIYYSLSKFGSKRIEEVIEKLMEDKDVERLRKVSLILEKIPDQQSISTLQNLVEHDDLLVRNNAIFSLCQLRDHYPLLVIDENQLTELLIEEASYNNKLLNILIYENTEKSKDLITVMKRKIDENLSIIFNILHIIYPPEQYLEIYAYMNSPDQTLRNNAIEYLESTLGPSIRKSIVPLLDYYENKKPKQRLETNIHSKMIHDFLVNNRDPEIKLAAEKYYESELF